ncbi:MAG: acyltransferase [Prevotella sp.]|nr:acyltransferase [Prevotella sp.]
MMIQHRNIALDILKFFAVILITNSHFDNQYVYAKGLATGGAIGDALFFFISGYSLFLGRVGRFDNWYKRRIRRIYPSVFALAIVTSMLHLTGYDMIHVILYGGDWFVSCIMLYYIVLYFIRRHFVEHLNWCYAAVAVILLIWYVAFYNHDNYIYIYKDTYIKWLFFFFFMLQGAQMGWREHNGAAVEITNAKRIAALLITNIFLFYGIQLFCRHFWHYDWLMITTLIPLGYICLNFYRLCSLERFKHYFETTKVGWAMGAIGGLCLEVYLTQPFVRTTAINNLFPLNLIIIFVGILLAAYIVRAFGRFFQQTFSSEDGYQWKEILKVK